MTIELEIKLRVDSHDPIRQRLAELKAEWIGRVLEFNRIFDRPDGSLRRTGCGLRVRQATDQTTAGTAVAHRTGTHLATLTFKGPVLAGPVKSREEVEVAVANADAAAALLERLGFVSILNFEKRRESWRLGDCLVELDEPPHIGLFVEIEGPSVEAIRDAQRTLGLAQIPHESASYVRMLAAYCETHGIADRTLRCT